jgi:4a-hydroxytetrahydrobiopterin dehydratase
MTDHISPKQFRESEGVDDWRVLGDGANAYFRTGSLALGARLVQAISELPGIDDVQPDVDVRHDGVTLRLVAFIEGYGGMLQSHVEMTRKISAAAVLAGCARV